MRRSVRKFLAGIFLGYLTISVSLATDKLPDSLSESEQIEQILLQLGSQDVEQQILALKTMDEQWQDVLAPAVLEYISITRDPVVQIRGFELLINHTRANRGYDINDWFSWVWEQQFSLPPAYGTFKSNLYRKIDVRFAEYFSAKRDSVIHLDEIRWGGVHQDGIPPLREPGMITVPEATYLDDTDIVFGIEVNGDFRAYPKRILAWHEMFVDTVGDVPVVGVYCTLCGSMILYESTVDGVEHAMGTSGFLYRSNKLMYDKATQSLWNTMWGTPAVGPLVNKGIRLPRRTVVTTTWGEWHRRHPETQVLSLETGHRRDYGEGVAYREYFADDELMFNTSQVDDRLANKAEVLGIVFIDENARPLAIAAEHARSNTLLHESVGERRFVVVTDNSGAMRVYESNDIQFVEWDGDAILLDRKGIRWKLFEDRLVSDDGRKLSRLASHSAFWFGWYGAYPKTRLLFE